MNKVFMVGRLTADPQQFVTQNGITQSRISIASNDNWNKNEVYFFPCVAWQTTANFINTYLKKGDLVAIDGKLIRRSYVSKEGKNVFVMEVVIESIKPLGGRTPSNNYEQPSSLDENYKNQMNTTKSSSNDFAQPKVEESQFAYDSNMSQQSEKPTLKDDPFEMNNSEDDDVVNLDWLKDFSDY